MVFHWNLSEGKSPQVSMTLLSILDDLNNTVVWMVSAHPLIFKSSSPFTNPLVIVPNAPITIDITVTQIFHSCFFFFFNSLARTMYFSLSSVLPMYFSLSSVLPCGQPEQRSPLFSFTIQFSFFIVVVDYHKSRRD